MGYRESAHSPQRYAPAWQEMLLKLMATPPLYHEPRGQFEAEPHDILDLTLDTPTNRPWLPMAENCLVHNLCPCAPKI